MLKFHWHTVYDELSDYDFMQSSHTVCCSSIYNVKYTEYLSYMPPSLFYSFESMPFETALPVKRCVHILFILLRCSIVNTYCTCLAWQWMNTERSWLKHKPTGPPSYQQHPCLTLNSWTGNQGSVPFRWHTGPFLMTPWVDGVWMEQTPPPASSAEHTPTPAHGYICTVWICGCVYLFVCDDISVSVDAGACVTIQCPP